jgi:glycosyltransferase involved in cell wall biosynthesis
MKILQISTQVFTVPPMGYGGLEGVVEDLSVELLKLGHQVAIVAPEGSMVPGAEMITPCKADANNPEGAAYEQYKSRLAEFDIIHTHSWQGHVYLAKEENPKLRIMGTIHSMRPWMTAPPVKFPCLVGASKYHAQMISAWSKCHVEHVYHGINLATYNPTRTVLSPVGLRDYLLYVARVVPFKGAHEFVSLCHKLKIKGLLVGEDKFIDDPAYVRRVMDSCDGKRVEYLGMIPRGSERMVELMQNARAVISPLLPPYDEIFGLTTVEAMASGTPFISTDRGAAKELLIEGKTGFVVPSVNELADAVSKLSGIKPEECLARAQFFDRKRMAQDYEALYGRMMRDDCW